MDEPLGERLRRDQRRPHDTVAQPPPAEGDPHPHRDGQHRAEPACGLEPHEVPAGARERQRGGPGTRRYDSPWAAVTLAALLVATLLGIRLAAAGGADGFTVAGDRFVRDAPGIDTVHPGTGYDGQFVYRMTLEPFPRETTRHGITLDNPPYRAQRVGLPLLAHALSRTGIPPAWSLIAVNVLALLAAAAAAAVLAQRHRRHALWGVAVALSPGLVVSLTRDLTEPLATALLLAGLVAWPRRPILATTAFTAAVLTRETVLAVLAGLGLYELYRLAKRRPQALRNAGLLLVPLAVTVAWQLHLRSVWGELPISATDGDVGTPFLNTVTSLFQHGDLTDWATRDAILENLWLAERLALAAFLAYAVTRLRRVDGVTATGFVLALLLAVSAAWHRDVGFLRAANEAIVMGLLVAIAARATKPLVAAAAASAGVAALYGAIL